MIRSKYVKKVKTWKYVLAVVVIPFLTACVSINIPSSYPAFSVNVVDAETGEPIEGAIMLASWSYRYQTLHDTEFAGYGAIKEAVSDENGKVGFYKRIPATKVVGARLETLGAPYFLIYKKGYITIGLGNISKKNGVYKALKKKGVDENNRPARYDGSSYLAIWNGATVKLKRSTNFEEDLSKHWAINFYTAVIAKAENMENACPWDVMPRSFIAGINFQKELASWNEEFFKFVFRKRYNQFDQCDDLKGFEDDYL